MLRPKKSQVIALVSEKAPEYVEFFREFQSYDGGWLTWPEFLIKVKANLKLDNYVLLYEDHRKINVCLFLFMMGEDGWKQWNDNLKNLSQDDQLATIEEFAQDLIDDDGQWLAEMIGEIPSSPEEESKAKSLFEALSKEEQVFLQKRASFLFLHILSAIHNYFSIMVNGEMMTSLVPKAMKGDQDAFCKAVKIDRNLITSHPYFKSRYEEAQANGEREFLRRISVNQTSQSLRQNPLSRSLYRLCYAGCTEMAG